MGDQSALTLEMEVGVRLSFGMQLPSKRISFGQKAGPERGRE